MRYNAFDLVRTPKGDLCLVTDVCSSSGACSVDYIISKTNGSTKGAWWEEGELNVVTNLKHLCEEAGL